MRYKNKSLPISKVMMDFRGIIEPLCNTCQTRDCTHVVETKKISVFGIARMWRVISRGTEPMAVVDCQGYSR